MVDDGNNNKRLTRAAARIVVGKDSDKNKGGLNSVAINKDPKPSVCSQKEHFFASILILDRGAPHSEIARIHLRRDFLPPLPIPDFPIIVTGGEKDLDLQLSRLTLFSSFQAPTMT